MQIQPFLKKYTYAILVAILCLAAALRFYKIDEYGFAGDEKYGLLVSQFLVQEGGNQPESLRKLNSPYFTPKEFWKKRTYEDFEQSIANRENGTSAFYSLMNHYNTEIFGVSDFTMRMPSLIFNVLTILLLFIFVRVHLKSDNLALLSAFLAAISPYFINYSQIARNYAVLAFFALLSVHLLLLIFRDEERNRRPIFIYFDYGLVVFICLMNHYSIFPLFLIQGLFCLIYLRKQRAWLGLTLAMIIPVIGMLYWVKFSGGQWSMHSIKQSAIDNHLMAVYSPNEWIAVTSFTTVIKQLRHIFSMQFLIIDGISFAVSGIKNFILSVLLAFSFGFITAYLKNTRIQLAAAIVICLGAYFIFTVSPIQYIILSVGLFGFYTLIRNLYQKFDKVQFFVVLLAVLPIFFLVVFSIQDKNTMRIIPRYIAYSYAFALICVAIMIKNLLAFKGEIKYFFGLILLLQFYYIANLIKAKYTDKPLAYFQIFNEPRTRNPYKSLADKIIQNYAKGDTVIYPSYQPKSIMKGYNMPTYSVQDAQYTNCYLPKNSDIIQRVDKNESNKVILKKLDGSTTLLFDFKETKFRY
ncbi:MAG: glycosyltransferase family 39 protein [Emticicia sp.]|uniref:glycosyltransferase family 39 protein n=1 Tax=Emticicia sp. TaxID=1930953 RepID=UPI003BA7CAAD